MDALKYFEKAVKLGQNGADEKFVEETLSIAMDRVLSGGAPPIAFSSGENILVALAGVSVPAAKRWRHLRGPDAWQPTSKCPYPLLAALDPDDLMRGTASRYLSSRIWPLSQRLSAAPGLIDLVMDGFSNAMPLRAKDMEGLAGKDQKERKSALEAQHLLTSFMMLLSSSWIAYKDMRRLWGAFQKNDGALVFKEGMFPGEAVEKKVFTPGQMVWRYQSGSIKAGSWESFWREDYAEKNHSAGHVIGWLDAYGVDTQEISKISFMRKMESLFREDISGARIWEKAHKAFSGLPGAWDLEEDGKLFWQTLLGVKTSAIEAAIKLPPPGGLEQKSTTGQGIWDALEPAHRQIAIGLLNSLNAKEKVCTRIDPVKNWSENGFAFARNTISKNPSAWTGVPSEAQDIWAAKLLAKACEYENGKRENAANIYCLLMERPENRASLGPAAETMLWVIGEMHAEGLLDRAPLMMKWPEDQPRMPSSDPRSARTLLRHFAAELKARKPWVDTAKQEVARSLIEGIALRSENVQSSKPARASVSRRL